MRSDTSPDGATIAALRAMPLLAGTDASDLAPLLRGARLLRVTPGHSVFGADTPCESLFHVQSGLLKLMRYGRAGGELLDLAGRGRTLGLTALLSGAGHPFDAVAIERCELLQIAAVPLLRFLEERPKRLLRVGVQLARRHQRMLDRAAGLANRSAVQRVAGFLLESASTGYDELQPAAPIGSVRHADVANLLGIKPETLSRTLARFRREGLIRDHDGVVDVVDRDGLREVLGHPGPPPEQAKAS